jgi:hypothetical protein
MLEFARLESRKYRLLWAGLAGTFLLSVPLFGLSWAGLKETAGPPCFSGPSPESPS